QESDIVFRELKDLQQTKKINMIIKATSDGIKEYTSTMSEVTKENIPLLSGQDLHSEHIKSKESALKIFIENVKCTHEVWNSNTAEHQQFSQRLEDEYNHFKKQQENRKISAITEYEKAKLEATNRYMKILDDMVIKLKGQPKKSHWETWDRECLNSALGTFTDHCKTAYIAIPQQREELIEVLTK
ncbi:unnamed protein product, partial [Meganyctiphanes norvegica]